MGDFYETFYEDALITSRVLGIALTSRNHGKSQKVPLAGFPHQSLDRYVALLMAAGYKVAVCDQLEDAQFAKGIVKRDVTEVITPGTALRPSLLDEKRNNYLLSIASNDEKFGLAAIDLSTGNFSLTEISKLEELSSEIAKFEPREILLPALNKDILLPGDYTLTIKENDYFSLDYGYQKLCNQFQILSLEGFGCEDLKAGICAAGAILAYLEENQKTTLNHIRAPKVYNSLNFMVLDNVAQVNLELVRRIREPESQEGTLLAILDKTCTPMGARELRSWLLAPLLNVAEIQRRQRIVKSFVESPNVREELRDNLKNIYDLERLSSRISCGRAGPRDLVALKDSLSYIPKIRGILEQRNDLLREFTLKLSNFSQTVGLIEKTIVDDPPLSATEGGVIREGISQDLDILRDLSLHSKEWIANLQIKERERTGIQSLKVGYNNVFGYYIEVTKPNLRLVPPDYIRKQTIANGERFVTPELKEYETKVLDAEEKMRKLEYELFLGLRSQVALEVPKIQESAKVIAEIDSLLSLALVAVANGYCCPEVNEESLILIKEGRHPIVEKLLPEGNFVPNDTLMDNEENTILIITGPNMAGKSTYLRQIALIIIMAQIGSYVPAKEARIGVVDRIFTRVGAADDLAKGRSTFLIEMSEAANILHNATPKSLVLLDEIGRGTSTFDGLSIAWAVTEYLHNNPKVSCKTLFATHYHELTDLAAVLPRVKNYNVLVKEWGDEIVFLRKVVEGSCDRSYGIQVAKLAGLPPEVVERAKEVLSNLEMDELTPDRFPRLARRDQRPQTPVHQQLDLFSPLEHSIIEELKKLEILKLSPLEALNKLAELKKKLLGKING